MRHVEQEQHSVATTTESMPKFRLVLPIGQEPPPGYVQVGTRTLPMGELDSGDDRLGGGRGEGSGDSYLQLPSGLLLQELPPAYFRERDWYARRSSSPSDSGVMSPESWHDELDRQELNHSCLCAPMRGRQGTLEQRKD